MYGAVVIISAVVACCLGQRSPYAGRRPIGYPEMDTTTTTMNPLGNRFGVTATTERLPIEALGDRELVNRLSKLPTDKQPFWLLNWKHLEAFRKNPQTWQQNPNVFIEQMGGVNSQGPSANPNSNTFDSTLASQNRFGVNQNMENSFDVDKRRYEEDFPKHDADAMDHGDKMSGDIDRIEWQRKHDSNPHAKGSH